MSVALDRYKIRITLIKNQYNTFNIRNDICGARFGSAKIIIYRFRFCSVEELYYYSARGMGWLGWLGWVFRYRAYATCCVYDR